VTRAASSWRQTLGVLAAAAVLLLFANGRNNLAAAAWLAPVLLLRFVRSQPAGRGLIVTWFVLSAAWSFQLRGMAPLPLVGYFVLAGVYGFVLMLPFLVDRLVAPRLAGVRATLVLPTAWVTVEYLVAQFTPYGSWGNAAYTQHEALTLLQVTSITGMYGIGFLIAWFAAVANQVWERDPAWRRTAFAFVAVAIAVLAYGSVRLAFFPPTGPTVRVAGITRADIDLFPDPEVAGRVTTGEVTDEEFEGIRERGRSLNEDLLRRSKAQADAGAQIVVWGEANAFVFKEDEAEFLREAGDVARAGQIWLGVAVGTWNAESAKPLENKIVLIDPEGKIAWEFWKAIPVPGGEAAISALLDGKIKTVATPHGEIGGAICYDMDFPKLLAQAGRLNTDILLAPSNDWREIDPWHSHMARYRAIEQGFNLVRHTSGGLSIATDYQGRVLASMDHYTATDRVLVAQVPTRGVRTIYSRVGDLFAWMCMLGVVILPFSRRGVAGESV